MATVGALSVDRSIETRAVGAVVNARRRNPDLFL